MSGPFPGYITDIHTHTPGNPHAILSLDPTAEGEDYIPDTPFSAGIHPWSERCDEAALARVAEMTAHPNAMAVGETGIDKMRSPRTLREQVDALRRHAAISEAAGKPLILHVVGGWNEVMALKRELRPRQPWIIHGFRGKPQLAGQLLDAGFMLSFGRLYNAGSFDATPAESRLHETDQQAEKSFPTGS